MEPTSNKYSLGGQRPLRSRSPHKGDVSSNYNDQSRVIQGRSPLRSGSPKFDRSYKPASMGNDYQQETQNEEQQYELRRQEELRRQIRMKEQELETLSNNKDRLRQRMERSLNQPSFAMSSSVNDSRVQTSNSPLRKRYPGGSDIPSQEMSKVTNPFEVSRHNRSHSRERSTSKGRDVTPPNRGPSGYPRQTSSSPLRNKSGSPVRQSEYTSIKNSLNDPLPRLAPQDYISQLHSDNASLQRRLNLVLAELDRVNRERGTIASKLAVAQDETNNLESRLDDEHRTGDKINRDMQIDVNGQRDFNRKIKLDISAADRQRGDAINNLRIAQGERERKVQQCEDLKNDLNRKMALLKDLEQQQFFNQEKIQKLQEQIDYLTRQELTDNHQKHDIQLIIDRLTLERDDLRNKLEQLNRTYDNCVMEITRERQQIEGHNKHHTKLLVFKILHQRLEAMINARKQEAMNEFYTYCRFDEKCHATLKQFVNVLDRLGKYKMLIAIKQWHQKAFKPIEMAEQNHDLTDDFYIQKLKQRHWNKWRMRYKQNVGEYSEKTKALNQIWNLKATDVRKDLQRAFTIWRDATFFKLNKYQKLKIILGKVHSDRRQEAFYKWIDYSNNLTWQVRMHLLAQQFAQDQLKQITLHQLKLVTFERKRKRINRQRHVFKAWKDYIRYRKYMMGANVALRHLKGTDDHGLLQFCFNVLRQNKETEKHLLMTQALDGDCEPAISALNRDIARVTNQAMTQSQRRSLETIKRMLNAQIGSYFTRWKNLHGRNKYQLNKNVKDHIVKLYKNQLQDAFNQWKKGKAHREIFKQQGMICELQEEGSGLNDEVMTISKKISTEKARVDRSARTALNRGMILFNNRSLRQYLRKWYESVDHRKQEEDKSALIIKRIRQRLVKQAFRKYHQRTLELRQDAKNERRLEQLIATFEERRKRRVFNALCVYKTLFGKAKTYWSIVLTKMDLWMKMRAFKNWQTNAYKESESLLKQAQNEETEQWAEENNDLGQLTLVHEGKHDRNKQLDKSLKKIGKKSLAHAFARNYYGSVSRSFSKWKEVRDYERQREALMKRTVNQWRKHQAYFLKSVFSNWAHKCKIEEAEAELKHTKMLCEEAAQMGNHKQGIHSKDLSDLDKALAGVDAESQALSHKLGSTIGVIIRINDKNYFQSNLRYIFQQWALYVKRQKHFATTLQNVITKSVWKQGFENIAAFANDKQVTRNQNKGLTKFRRMFYKSLCGDAFSRWRGGIYSQTVNEIENYEQMTDEIVTVHKKKVKKIQDRNCVMSSHLIRKKNLHNYYKAWKNVTRWLKHARHAKEATHDGHSNYLVKRAIKRWKQRADVTKLARDRYLKMRVFQGVLMKRAVFNALKTKYQREKNWCVFLSNLANKMDHRAKRSALQMIVNFERSKKYAHEQSHEHSSRDVYTILNQLYLKKMTQYLSHFRNVNLREKHIEGTKYTFLKHIGTLSLRHAFMKWKKKTECLRTVQEVNEQGPVVEQVLDHTLDFKNCQKFMEDQGYTKEEVSKVTKMAEGRVKELLARSIARMKHYTEDDDLYLKPKMFDRWKMYVKIRKLVRHWLQYIENRQQHHKADLAVAFDRWKYHYPGIHENYTRKTREKLLRRAVEAGKRLHELADSTGQNEDLLNHLGMQRDDLQENYIKSQRLAIVLGRDNLTKSLRKGFTMMQADAHAKKKAQYEKVLQGHIELIAKYKDKISELENDNESLAQENEELRQFSLDGYQIAKNVQSLTSEREKLSVDLADKANTIKKLLDENELLGQRLRVAQEQAQILIQQSQRQSQRVN